MEQVLGALVLLMEKYCGTLCTRWVVRLVALAIAVGSLHWLSVWILDMTLHQVLLALYAGLETLDVFPDLGWLSVGLTIASMIFLVRLVVLVFSEAEKQAQRRAAEAVEQYRLRDGY